MKVQAKVERSSFSPSVKRKFERKWKWNPGQDAAIDLLAGPQQHSLLYGGGRSGKTFLYTWAIVQRGMRAENSRHLFTRFRGNAVRASVWLDTFPKVMRTCFPDVKYTDHRQDGFVSLPRNGAQFWFGGLDDKDRVEKILGQEYATIYPGECSQIPYHSILVLRTRLAQSGTGLRLRGFYDLNPVGQAHWTYREFVQKVDPITRLALPNPEDFDYATISPEQNKENLDPNYLRSLRNLPGKYKSRFYKGEYVVEVDGALWTADLIERSRVDAIEPNSKEHKALSRIAVAVDPSGASTPDTKGHRTGNDEIGIAVGGITFDKRGVLLEDASLKDGPKVWAARAVAMYKKWKANVIVAEQNFGGEMVRTTIQAVDPNVPVKLVSASRGKHVRAEPISTLHNDNRIEFAGNFPELEDQLCMFAPTGYTGTDSPDRADAAVWLFTELMLEGGATGVLDYYAQIVAQMKADEENRKREGRI